MVSVKTCIQVYSDLNPWMNYCFVIEPYCNFGDAEDIINDSFNSWWDSEEAHDIPIVDWIERHLTEKDIAFETYFGDKREGD